MRKVSGLVILLLVVVSATCMAWEKTSNIYSDGPFTGNLEDGDYVVATGSPTGTGWVSLKKVDLSKLQGPQGEQGPQGDQGIQGEQGEKGNKGDKGDDGEDFNDETRYLLRVQYNLYRRLEPKGFLSKVGVFSEYDFRYGNLDEVGLSVEFGK